MGETYTLTYTPDRKTNSTFLAPVPSVISVLTNAPGMDVTPPYTNTIKKYIGADILVAVQRELGELRVRPRSFCGHGWQL